jgi:hypothetical protein
LAVSFYKKFTFFIEKERQMRRIGLIGSVVLVCCAAFASAETLDIKGTDNIFDGYVSVTYGWRVFDREYVIFREYWPTDYYDARALIRVDLSTIPEGTVIDSASFKLKVHSETTNPATAPFGVDLWQASYFTEDVAAFYYDGVNFWPDGVFDGVNGYYRTPEDRILATTPIHKDMIGSYVEFSDSRLNDYLQIQSDQPEGERYAYFQMSWPEPNCDYFGGFYASEAAEGDQPYLEISWGGSAKLPGDANGDGVVNVGDLGILAGNYGTLTGATWEMGDFNGDGAVNVGDLGILAGNYGSTAAASVPEPATLSLLGMGILALLRRKR